MDMRIDRAAVILALGIYDNELPYWDAINFLGEKGLIPKLKGGGGSREPHDFSFVMNYISDDNLHREVMDFREVRDELDNDTRLREFRRIVALCPA